MTVATQQVQRPLTGNQFQWRALAAAVIAGGLLAIWTFGQYGLTETGALLFTRYTARVSFLFFLPVFTAKALQTWFPGQLSALLLKRRRQLGLAFAAAHGIHMIGIITLLQLQDRWFTAEDGPALVIYLFVGLLAITSSTLAVRRLGNFWKALHWLGMYAIFVGFFATYWGRLGSDQITLPSIDPLHEWYASYLVLAVTVTLAWLLRISAFWKLRLAVSTA